jgi:hypothetical protein
LKHLIQLCHASSSKENVEHPPPEKSCQGNVWFIG